MPLFEGMALKNCSNASSPPADAPMPTTKAGPVFDRSKRNTALDLVSREPGVGVVFRELRFDVAVFRLMRFDSLPIKVSYMIPNRTLMDGYPD